MDKFERMRKRIPEMEEVRALIDSLASVGVAEQPEGELAWGESAEKGLNGSVYI